MKKNKGLRCRVALFAALLFGGALMQRAMGQDQYDQDDPPSRVARLGYMQGSVSFQPAGESEWVEATPNRPMTTGDQLWADRDSRAELNLGSAVVSLNSNTGVSFLNLDDRTAQIQLSAGSINVRVRRLHRDDVFEIDTPNQAFSIYEPGRYRVEASEDGAYTVVSIREGEGESTGNGETYTLHAGQRATFEGTDRLNAQVEDIGGPDDFDNWSDRRYRRYDDSRSARYVSPDVVGYEDLDDNGDWRPDSTYGNVWYPHVSEGWAPYREGHWAWVDPWGWTWVDDEPWGYAPFHYGRWCSVGGRWGWVPGPVQTAAVYAPALVVFVGGGAGFAGNMGWFPLGPREVYVPSYRVSRGYVDRVNVSNTNVNTTTVTNVYNTTIVNNNTVINNVTYVNKNVSGAVTAVPQQAFRSGQPVARAAVPVNAREIASAPVNSRAAVAPTSNSVLGLHASTANRVSAPPAAVASRPVVAKAKAPPAPVPFAARQQALASHPGQPIPRQEMQRLQPTNQSAAARPQVKQAPPGKPATATAAQPGRGPENRPGNPPAANAPAPNERPGATPGQPNRPAPNNQPATNNRPAEPPARNDRPPSAQPNNRPEATQPGNRPQPNQPQPNNRPAEPPARNDRPPSAQPNNRPEPPQPGNRPQPNQPQPNNRPAEPPARNDRPPSAQPNNRPEANQPNNRPAEPPQRNDRPPTAQPNNRPAPSRPAEPPQRQPEPPQRQAEPPQRQPEPPQRQAEPPQRSAPPPQRTSPPPSERPEQRPSQPPQARPTPPPQHPTPEEKKKPEEPQKPQGL